MSSYLYGGSAVGRGADRDNGQAGILVGAAGWGQFSTIPLTANRSYYQRFVPSRPMLIVSIGFVVTTFATVDDPCDAGIYNAALARLGSAGSTAGKLNATTGVKVLTMTAPIPLVAGTPYYAAFGSGTVGGTAANLCMNNTQPGQGDLFGTSYGVREYFRASAVIPLPNPAVPTDTVVNTNPVLALREF